MDPSSALELMWRDVVELATLDWFGRTALMLFVLLPIASLVMARRGPRSAWIPLATTGGLLLAWMLYYTTGWWEQLAAGTAFTFGGLAVTGGWLVLGWQLIRSRPGDTTEPTTN